MQKKKTDLYMGPQPCARQCAAVTDGSRLVRAVGKTERKRMNFRDVWEAKSTGPRTDWVVEGRRQIIPDVPWIMSVEWPSIHGIRNTVGASVWGMVVSTNDFNTLHSEST